MEMETLVNPGEAPSRMECNAAPTRLPVQLDDGQVARGRYCPNGEAKKAIQHTFSSLEACCLTRLHPLQGGTPKAPLRLPTNGG